MSIQDYVKKALRTETDGDRDSAIARLDHAAMGLVTEAGELVDMLKKHKRYGREFDFLHFIEELGDVAWYTALAADQLGLKFPEILKVPHHKALPGEGVTLTQVGWIDFNVGLLVYHASEFNMIVRRMRYQSRSLVQDMSKLPVHVTRTLRTLNDLAEIAGFTLDHVLDGNIAKLSKRYPGKFTEENAFHRDLDAENEALREAMVNHVATAAE